ncbi:MAG: hypothetical protein BGO67_06470 [Alphaproteobacteria bacterium 41-28]|nr:MAG: hypothetical protein BGO67_06470 [Alphaproteobacteria bacterium 41-28]
MMLRRVSALIGFCFVLWHSPAECMEEDKDNKQVTLSKVKATFQDNKGLIEGWFSDVTESQIHFYWTLGRKASDLPKEGETKFQVHVGGKKYSETFPLYLKTLLEETPSNLTVKFICDPITYNSNSIWLKDLEEHFGGRFKTVYVADIIENIVSNLPEKEDIIRSIFRNAEGGNPAIASDLYRLLGMIYGHSFDPTELKSKRLVYCDEDTFAYGLEHKDSVQLLAALFQKLSLGQEKPFMIGRRRGSNDVVKLEVSDLESYKLFCLTALGMLEPYQENSIDYYPHLYSLISAAERSEDCDSTFAECLEYVSSKQFTHKDIFQITGPGLLDSLSSIYEMELLTSPSTCTFAWYGAEPLETGDFKFRAYRHTYDEIPYDNKCKLDLLQTDFKEYSKKVALAFYAKRFGEKHPFYQKLFNHLVESNPFKDKEIMGDIKEILQKCYDDNSKSRPEMSIEEWLQFQFKVYEQQMKCPKSADFVPRLLWVLKALGIEFELTVQDLNFRK